MSHFHNIKVKDIVRETPDAVCIVLDIPETLKEEFRYIQGQYITFRYGSNGNEVRRSYSLCSSPYSNEPLKVAVKEVANGTFSTYANRQLKPGDTLEAMKPEGNFHTALDVKNRKHYVAIVAGSGITPVMSIVKSVVQIEPESRVTLIYGNRDPEHIILKKELDALQQQATNRLQVHYVFSRSGGSDDLSTGRITADKTGKIMQALSCTGADEFFICGPEELIFSVKDKLEKDGVDRKRIHFELFNTPVKTDDQPVDADVVFDGDSEVTIIMNGEETTFTLNGKGKAILDAAMDHDVDAPFSCKGAVCCTCKAKVVSGKAYMEMNYALTDDEVEEGYILTCQSHPVTPKIVVDFDV